MTAARSVPSGCGTSAANQARSPSDIGGSFSPLGTAGLVENSTSEPARDGCASATRCARAPPIEMPASWALRRPSASSTPTASAARSAPVYPGAPAG
jgi:hypothetical protein